MAKHFKSKRKLRKLWILEYVLLLVFTYFLIKLCIYSLVDIPPNAYFSMEFIGKEFYSKIKKSTINNPLFLLDYQAPLKDISTILPVISHPKENDKNLKIRSEERRVGKECRL